MPEPVIIDGSYGEGGGQVLRTSLSLSAITGRPLELVNIRAKRSSPGLKAQHLTSVRAAAALCNATLSNAVIGSRALTFVPQTPVQPHDYHFDIGTAGATTLVCQTALAALATSGEAASVRVTGGTHVPHAPALEYVEAVYLPVLRQLGVDASLEYPRAGFFPKGGGKVHLHVEPGARFQPLDLTDRGALVGLRAYVITAGLPDHVADRGGAAVEKWLKGVGRKAEVEVRVKESLSPGAAVVLVAECERGRAGFSAIGERGKPMEAVATDPCEAFMRWWKSEAAVDEHLADQLVLPLALADGESRWTTSEVTEHLRTVLWVAQQFLPVEYAIEETAGGGGTVTLRGAGGTGEWENGRKGVG